ncbi:DUF6301 family protein [Prescottella equi]|uniref:DUF6301 family protein n=1 Tax=Rhodococcus hoagii TaxID=43767 RepID=UPI00131ECB16|nr:DUF6301 family protein [Prescottella equi]
MYYRTTNSDYEKELQQMRADIERAAQAVRAAAEFDWTWTVHDLPPFCGQVGWQVSGLDEQFPAAVTNLEVNRPDVMVGVADISTTDLSRAINQIAFRASDVVLGRSDLEPELDDVFNALVQRMFELLGQRPTDWWIEPTRGLRWDLPGLVVRAKIGVSSVWVYLLSPAYQQWRDEIEQSAEDE